MWGFRVSVHVKGLTLTPNPTKVSVSMIAYGPTMSNTNTSNSRAIAIKTLGNNVLSNQHQDQVLGTEYLLTDYRARP